MSVRIDKPRRGWSTVLLGILTVALFITSLPTASTTITSTRMQSYLLTMAQETPDELVSVIIQKQRATVGLEGFVTRLGGKITKDLQIINAFGAQVTANLLPILARAPGVHWISLDAPVYDMNATSSDPGSDTVQVRDEFNAFSYTGSDGTGYWGEP